MIDSRNIGDMAPRVTIVVCTRDRPIELQACLGALLQQQYSQFDILVVDNGVERVDELCRSCGVACIREPAAGLTHARNLGARAARGEIVAYIDDDAIAEPGWVAALARAFETPGVAAVAGRTRYMCAVDGSLRMTSTEAPEQVERPRLVVDRSVRDWFTLACFGGIGDGNTMAFRRQAVVEAVRFDERIGRGRAVDGGDEHVAFMSLIADGYQVVREPGAVVRHPVPADPRRLAEKQLRDLRGSIAYLLFLFAQFSSHRLEIARFVAAALVKRARALRVVSERSQVTRGERVGAVIDGCRTYMRARREWSAGGPAEVKATAVRVVTLR